MNQETFDILVQFPYQRSNGRLAYYTWMFYDNQGKLIRLEFANGYVSVKDSVIDISSVHVITDYNTCRYLAAAEAHTFVEEHLECLRNAKKNYDVSMDLIHQINSHFDRNHCYAGGEHGWVIDAAKIYIKITLDMYKDPYEKTIKFEHRLKTGKKTEVKQSLVNNEQLMTFIKKNLLNLKDTSHMKKVPTIESTTLSLSKLNISEAPTNKVEVLPRTVVYNTYKNLFHNIPREKRIEYQSCKPVLSELEQQLQTDYSQEWKTRK